MALVMIMEDEPNIAKVLEIVLTEDGNEVITAPNGLVGMQLLKQDPAPDVIFIDLNMPVMNGKEVIENIHSDKKLRKIPVVILSGSFPDSSVLPPRSHYKAMLEKPFDINELSNMVDLFTAQKQQAV